MDKTLLSQLRVKYPDATTGTSCRSSTYINPHADALGHREWLEASRIDGVGWSVRRMVWKPAVSEHEDAKIAQTYVANSNIPNHGLNFVDALLKLHEYENAQPLLGYLSDPDDTGAMIGSAHYKILASAEGIIFEGMEMILPVNGVIAVNGEFDARTIKAAFDSANRALVAKSVPNYDIAFPMPHYGSGRVCNPFLSETLTKHAQTIRFALNEYGSVFGKTDCSFSLNPFYRPQFCIFEKELRSSINAMHKALPLPEGDFSSLNNTAIEQMRHCINYLEFHALRLSLAWVQESIRDEPELEGRLLLKNYIARSMQRCIDILNHEKIPQAQFNTLLDFDFARANNLGEFQKCKSYMPLAAFRDFANTTEIDKIITWFDGLAGPKRPFQLNGPGQMG